MTAFLCTAAFVCMTSPGSGLTAPSTQAPATEIAKGVFLVASRNMQDPRFRESVVLLTSHTEIGTSGLIVNHPTDLSLAEAFPESRSLEQSRDRLYLGGPVEPETAQMLVRSRSRPMGSERVIDSVFVSANMDLLEQLGRTVNAGGETFRVFAGYAGWAPGQLENEILLGGWHVLPADEKTLFDRDPRDLWSELMRRIEPDLRLEARAGALPPGPPAG